MKTTHHIKAYFSILLLATLSITGCKKFLDVNENPNNPDQATPNLLLPTVEASIGQVVGNSFQVYGNFWAQYWTQNPSSSQYRTIDQYRVTGTAFDRPWITIYRNALQNAQIIIDDRTTPNSERTKGIAYLLKAYTFQLATDAFGDIPLSEALRGNEFRSPRFEPQKVVYDSIFRYINIGMQLVNTTNATSPATQDLIFQGETAQWIAFANTLKLRAYLRLSQVEPETARLGIAALYATSPTFLTRDASISYTSTGGNENPFYNELVGLGGTQNPVASATAVNAYKRNNDPRVFEFYDVIGTADSVANIRQGSYSSNSNKSVSPPSSLVGARGSDPTSATAPVKLISAAESYFLQAEAVARGWAPGSVTSLFTAGITESFRAVGIPNRAAAYISSAPDAQLPGTLAGNIRAIITQKYYAMNGFQGFEAWTEWRRTGYPDFLQVSAASTLGAGRMPLRFLYPNSELTTNLNYPGTIPIYEPVWWDK
jgi:hypothetical protein